MKLKIFSLMADCVGSKQKPNSLATHVQKLGFQKGNKVLSGEKPSSFNLFCENDFGEWYLFHKIKNVDPRVNLRSKIQLFLKNTKNGEMSIGAWSVQQIF